MTTRALVLGGGGPVGIAWECGLLAGFADGGVDLGRADFIMGTSAGAFVGAKLALGTEARALADPILAEADKPADRPGRGGGRPPADLTPLMQLMGEAQSGMRNPTEVRAEIGAYALAAETMSEDEFIASFGRSFANLPRFGWPEKDFACTAVDAQDGSFRLWTKAAGVGVTRAVASSCSVPGVFPPITLDGRRYIDGGMRSATNADLAAGYDVVVVVALRIGAGGGLAAERIAAKLDEEVQTLQDGGATVVVVSPDAASLEAFGVNLMDFRRRPDAARAGLAQGRAEAEVLQGFWG
jgi:NTE family protein